MSEAWLPILEKWCGKRGLSVELIRFQIAQESGTPGEPGTGNPNAVSSAGARGLLQIEPGTAADLLCSLGYPARLELCQDLLMVPEVSIILGTAYHVIYGLPAADRCGLRALDGIKGMMACYECGPGNMDAAFKKSGAPSDGTLVAFGTIAPFLPPAAKAYAEEIVSAWQHSMSSQS